LCKNVAFNTTFISEYHNDYIEYINDSIEKATQKYSNMYPNILDSYKFRLENIRFNYNNDSEYNDFDSQTVEDPEVNHDELEQEDEEYNNESVEEEDDDDYLQSYNNSTFESFLNNIILNVKETFEL
jgi:hypothetical protein